MISVIGGSGFVGSRLIRNLLKNYEVENLDKKQSPFFKNLTNIVNITNIITHTCTIELINVIKIYACATISKNPVCNTPAAFINVSFILKKNTCNLVAI